MDTLNFLLFFRDFVGYLYGYKSAALSTLLSTFKSFATLLLTVITQSSHCCIVSICLWLRWLPGVFLRLSFAFSKDKVGQKAVFSGFKDLICNSFIAN